MATTARNRSLVYQMKEVGAKRRAAFDAQQAAYPFAIEATNPYGAKEIVARGSKEDLMPILAIMNPEVRATIVLNRL